MLAVKLLLNPIKDRIVHNARRSNQNPIGLWAINATARVPFVVKMFADVSGVAKDLTDIPQSKWSVLAIAISYFVEVCRYLLNAHWPASVGAKNIMVKDHSNDFCFMLVNFKFLFDTRPTRFGSISFVAI